MVLKSTYVESLSLMLGRKEACDLAVMLGPMKTVPGGISHVLPEMRGKVRIRIKTYMKKIYQHQLANIGYGKYRHK